MKKLKNILFRMELGGRGVINFDSIEQKHMWNMGAKFNGQENISHNNVSFSKKRWYKNDDGSLSYRLVLSSNCLRYYIFIDDTMFQSSNVVNNSMLLTSMIATPGLLLRGYLFAEKEPSSSLKRTSVLKITDAEQNNNAVSTIEMFSRSGAKNSDDNKADITIYRKESVGHITYEAIGSFDLMQMQFVSCDELFDRLALNPDLFESYREFISPLLPNFNSTLSYYTIKNSADKTPEYGFKLSNENVVFLTKLLFRRLLNLSIRKTSAYAETVKLEYKLVYDSTEDKMNNNDGWITLTNEGINSLDFEVDDFYIESDFNNSKKLRLELEDKDKEKKERNRLNAISRREEAARRREFAKNKKDDNSDANSDDISGDSEN